MQYCCYELTLSSLSCLHLSFPSLHILLKTLYPVTLILFFVFSSLHAVLLQYFDIHTLLTYLLYCSILVQSVSGDNGRRFSPLRNIIPAPWPIHPPNYCVEGDLCLEKKQPERVAINSSPSNINA
jgi:hypothetical protein